ncbi:iron oxidase [Methylocystis sp. JAN1]|uniref:high-potential iron-sulfur protein n=1 Tax=Methylocystis sp. JAN1 TaxID=3397211 RepID=UPI003FA2735C
MNANNRGDRCGRRRLLKILGAAALLPGLGALFPASPALAKSSRAAAAYRGSPNGRQRCANCSWFEPPSGCGVVKGPVSANGWCNLWG